MADPSAAARAPAIPASTASLELARAAAAGDAAAISALLRAVAPRMASVVRVVLGRAAVDVDDVVQQALIGFVQALPAFRGECEPTGYATTIAVRTAVAARKRWRVQVSRRDDGAEPDALPEQRPSPGEEVAALRRKELVRDLLEELPVEQAEALALRFVVGWSLEEIAQRSGAPVNTVRSRLRLAKEALKRKIESRPDLADELEVFA